MTNLAIILRAMRRALQWRLLIVTPIVMLVAGAASAMWLWQYLGERLNYATRWQSLTTFDSSGLVMLAKAASAPSLTNLGLSATLDTGVLLAVLFAPLLAGAALVVATTDGRPRLGELVAGAVGQYPRLFRVQLATLVPLAIAGVVIGLIQTWASHVAEHATEEAGTHTSSRIAWIVTLVMVLVAQLVIDAARARLTVEPTRRSAVVALGAGIKLLVRRPLPALLLGLAANLAALVVAAALLVIRQQLAQTSVIPVGLAFVLGLLAVAAIGWGHAVRLCGLVELARASARPPKS